MDETNSVSVDTLKQQGFTDEDLAGHIDPDPTPEPQPEPQTDPTPEPIQEPTPEPNLEPEPEPAPGGVKTSTHVPYDRFKEVNDKNKVLAAELAALKAAQQPNTQPQQQPAAPQQPVQQQPQTSIEEQIEKIADSQVRDKLKIDATVDVNDIAWQMENPALYRKYLKEDAKAEYRLETDYKASQTVRQQNIGFVNELKAIPDFPTVYQFAIAELDELPGKQARVIGNAFDRIDRGIGSKEDHDTIRKFATECQNKMKGITQAPANGAISSPAAAATSPLDKAAGLPRAQTLSGSKTSAMSWAQVEDLIRQGKSDQIPPEMLKQIDPRLLE